jgi:hypothetical protein
MHGRASMNDGASPEEEEGMLDADAREAAREVGAAAAADVLLAAVMAAKNAASREAVEGMEEEKPEEEKLAEEKFADEKCSRPEREKSPSSRVIPRDEEGCTIAGLGLWLGCAAVKAVRTGLWDAGPGDMTADGAGAGAGAGAGVLAAT